MNITIKLLSEVLKSQVEIIDIDECKCMIRNSTYFDNEQIGITYQYLYGNKEIRFMAIYEFAFKCKEWALSNGYYLESRGVNILCKESMPKCEVEYIDKNNMFKSKDFYSSSEIEAIIKACEWILKEKNK